MKYCNKICSVSNYARLLHLSLTLFVFYVLLLTPGSDLHNAWQERNSQFFGVLFLLISSNILYLIASVINPGYVPVVKTDIPSLYDIKNGSIKAVPDINNPDDSDSLTDSDSKALVTGSTCRDKFCHICKHNGILRARHCKICNRCIRRYDHHCPWLGNCVGERNHRLFWLFLGLETPMLIWGVFIAWSSLQTSSNLGEWLKGNILTFPCLLIVFVGSIACSMLLVFHSFLMISGQTTWEMASRFRISYLRDLDPPINPFDEGFFLNIIHFLCCPGKPDWEFIYDKKVEQLKPNV